MPGGQRMSGLARRWPAIRARGMGRFVLVRGALTWGGLMFAFMAVAMWFNFGLRHPRFGMLMAIAALLCVFGGMIWAAVTWAINERIYRNHPPSKDTI